MIDPNATAHFPTTVALRNGADTLPLPWPIPTAPQTVGDHALRFAALAREYLFMSL